MRYYLYWKKIFISLLLIIICSNSLAQEFDEIRPFSTDLKREYSLEEIINITRNANYDLRSKAESVYQARRNITISMGRLLPSLNFNNVLTAVTAILEGNYFNLVLPFIGFIFPSNWFKWKESKFYFEAERKSYIVLIANQINAVESLVYQLQLAQSVLVLYNLYIDEIEQIIKTAKVRASMGENTRDFILQIENLQLLMQNDRISLENSLNQQYSELVKQMGLPITEWDIFKPAFIELPNLNNANPIDVNKVIPLVVERSQEIKEMKFLILAAQYSRKTRIFEFLSPTGNPYAAFGFGYYSYIQIGTSKIRELQIKRDELISNLHMTTRKAVNQYNTSIEFYINSTQGFKNANEWYSLLKEKFIATGAFDTLSFISALESLFLFHSQIVSAQHQVLVSESQIKRLLWNSPAYKGLVTLPPKYSPNVYIGNDQNIENKMIKTAIEKGEINASDLSGE